MANRHFAVIGSPITHSKSPLIHKAAYAHLGLNWDYTSVEIDASQFATFIDSTELSGVSITMPLKDIAFSYLGSQHGMAIASGTANTALKTSSGWKTFNTDTFGLVMALQGQSFDKVLILGTGATAKNAILAINNLKDGAKLVIRGRDSEKVNEAVLFASNLGLHATGSRDSIDVSGFSLVISTLPPTAIVDDWITGDESATLFDVAYSPWPSRLAERWLGSGGNVISGIEMLIWQAIAQIRIFKNGNDADPLDNEQELASVMRKAALAEG